MYLRFVVFAIYLIVSAQLSLNAHASQKIINQKNIVVSAYFVDLENNKVIYSSNPDVPMIPASIQKIITAYAAIKKLGASHTLQTQILKHKDTVYLKFAGDPRFSSKDLKKIITKLGSMSYKQIVIDDLLFDKQFWNENSIRGDHRFCFGSPISSMNIDKNCFTAKIKRTKQSGVSISHNMGKGIDIKNNISISQNPNDNCEMELMAHPDNKYELYGCWRDYDTNPSTLNIAVQNPNLYIKSLVEGKTSKPTRFGKIHKDATLVYTFHSKGIKTLAKAMLLESDNIIAKSFTKHLCDDIASKNYKNGTSYITSAMEQATDSSDFIMHDGTGLSRLNLISSKLFTKFLVSLYKDEAMRKIILWSLPIAGKRGTLKYKFHKNKRLKGKIFAKTGGMSSISSLAGYIITDSKRYAFTIIINNAIIEPKDLTKIQEAILEKVMLDG